MALEIQVLGLRQLKDNLKKVAQEATGNAAIAMCRTGANVFKKAAQDKVPEKTGNLKKSIYVKRITKLGGHIVYAATIRTGKRKTATARYAHLVEFGTRGKFINPKKKKALLLKGFKGYGIAGTMEKSIFAHAHHPGARPRPFMRPAFDENVGRALDRMTKIYNRRIDKWQTSIGLEPEES